VEGCYGRQQEQTSIAHEARLICPGVRPAVTSDPDIYRAAKLLIDQDGNDTPERATQRGDDLLEAGDKIGAATWRRILAAIAELRRGAEKGNPTPWGTPASNRYCSLINPYSRSLARVGSEISLTIVGSLTLRIRRCRMFAGSSTASTTSQTARGGPICL